MRRSFDLGKVKSVGAQIREPRIIVRAALGVLLLANLIAAGFAFHIFGQSADDVARQVEDARRQLIQQTNLLNRTKLLAVASEKARSEGDRFMAANMTTRRTTYSAILTELTKTAAEAGIKARDTAITADPVENSDTLSMLTVSANFEGNYQNLVKFINLLDRSPRFLIIESMQAAPQPNGQVVVVNIKLNAFVRDDNGGLA